MDAFRRTLRRSFTDEHDHRQHRSGGEGRALALVPAAAQPPTSSTLDRQALEDEHIRILARAVGDHLPYELALRAAAVAEQLQRCT